LHLRADNREQAGHLVKREVGVGERDSSGKRRLLGVGHPFNTVPQVLQPGEIRARLRFLHLLLVIRVRRRGGTCDSRACGEWNQRHPHVGQLICRPRFLPQENFSLYHVNVGFTAAQYAL
jgi:hypothetical protein